MNRGQNSDSDSALPPSPLPSPPSPQRDEMKAVIHDIIYNILAIIIVKIGGSMEGGRGSLPPPLWGALHKTVLIVLV